MKIVISAKGKNLTDAVDPRFGRCEYFIVFDTETKEFTASENENKERGGGAGIQSARFVVESGATRLLTGKVGPKAEEVLKAGNIDVKENCEGSVEEAINKYGI